MNGTFATRLTPSTSKLVSALEMEAFEDFRAAMNRGFNSQCDSLKAHLAVLESDIEDLKRRARRVDDLERQNSHLQSRLEKLGTSSTNADGKAYVAGKVETVCQTAESSVRLETLPNSLSRLVSESPELSRFLEQKASDYTKLKLSHSKLLSKAREYREALLRWQKESNAAASCTLNMPSGKTRQLHDNKGPITSEASWAGTRECDVNTANRRDRARSAPLNHAFSSESSGSRQNKTMALHEFCEDFGEKQSKISHASGGFHPEVTSGSMGGAGAQEPAKPVAERGTDTPKLHSAVQGTVPTHQALPADNQVDIFQSATKNDTTCETTRPGISESTPNSDGIDRKLQWDTNRPVGAAHESLDLDAMPLLVNSTPVEAHTHAVAGGPNKRPVSLTSSSRSTTHN